jgi:hypothetical protein
MLSYHKGTKDRVPNSFTIDRIYRIDKIELPELPNPVNLVNPVSIKV